MVPWRLCLPTSHRWPLGFRSSELLLFLCKASYVRTSIIALKHCKVLQPLQGSDNMWPKDDLAYALVSSECVIQYHKRGSVPVSDFSPRHYIRSSPAITLSNGSSHIPFTRLSLDSLKRTPGLHIHHKCWWHHWILFHCCKLDRMGPLKGCLLTVEQLTLLCCAGVLAAVVATLLNWSLGRCRTIHPSCPRFVPRECQTYGSQ